MNASSYVYEPFPCRFCLDPLWSSAVSWDTPRFDLTRCFKSTVLVWTPFVFFWIALPLEIIFAEKPLFQTRYWTFLSKTKLAVTILLIIHATVEVGFLVYYWKTLSNVDIPDAEVTAPILRLGMFAPAAAAVTRESRRGKPTSAMLFFFWVLVAISATLTFTSTLAQKSMESLPERVQHCLDMVYFPLVLLQLLLSCLTHNRHTATAAAPSTCPEEYSSFPSNLTFWWMTRLIYTGWRRPLVNEDLWDQQTQDRTEIHSANFGRYWSYELKHMQHLGNKYTPNLLKALWMTFKTTLAASATLKLLGDLLIFLAPLQLKLLIRFINNKDEETWKGYLYVTGMLLGSLAQVLTMGYYFLFNQRTGMHIRSAIGAAVYRKSLVMTSAATRSVTSGEIVNLLSVDSQRFMDFMNHIQLLWSLPLQIVLALVFLWQEMGVATLAGAAVLALLIPFNAWVASKSKGFQVDQMKSKDGRIKLTNEILNGIKILKLYAWELPFEQHVLTIREKELSTIQQAAHLNACSSFVMQISPFLVALVNFATFVGMGDANVLDAEKAFVSLTLFNILRRPLMLFPDAINSLTQTRVSADRVAAFLLKSELDLENAKVLPAGGMLAARITNGFFSWEDNREAQPLLRDINMVVPSGALVAIVGPVGSGKSSLVAALLGLMETVSGEVALQANVAYVTQHAWIQNMSLRANILFGEPFEESKYERVLRACALTDDLKALPAGDQTEIGEKGSNLSGGQKQRVSLARAVYSEAEMYLLDDPLSAVDAHVGKHIFENVIGPRGVLKDKTRIFVTHGVGFLHQTDLIIVMNNCRITEIGTYDELAGHDRGLGELLGTHRNARTPDVDDKVDETEPLMESSQRKPDAQTDMATALPVITQMAPANHSKGRLVQAEKTETEAVRWSTYLTFLRSMTWIVAFLVLVAYVASSAANVATNVWLGEWAEDAKHPERNQTGWTNYRLGVYGGLGSAQGLFILMSTMCLAVGQIRASRKQHEGMLLRIIRAPMAFFDTTPLGRIVNRFSKDMDAVDTLIPRNLFLWMNCFFQVLSTIVIICMATPMFALVVVPLGLLYYLMQRFYIPTSRQLKRLDAASRSPLYSHLQESISGSAIIVVRRQTHRFMLRNEELLDHTNLLYFASGHAQRWLSLRVEFIGMLAVFFAGLFAVIGRDKDWDINAKNIGLSISYALSVTQVLNLMVRVTSELETNIVSVERIQEYTEVDQEAPWTIEDNRPNAGWPSEGRVRFDNYKARYRKGLPYVLENVSAAIEPGEKVGIVGRTGAGKSSLTLAIFRLIEAASGQIFIDNVDISTIGLHDLRSQLTIIPQEPVMFSCTLRLNLDPFNVYSDTDIWTALSKSHLQEYVCSLKNGLQFSIAEGGQNLSVGQRQLICLARALLRKSRILILDEATAAVDLVTDALIQNTIREEFADCTVLTIAHRLTTVMDSSRVLVMDHGIVKEFASPESLLKDKSSMFYALSNSVSSVNSSKTST